MINVVVWSLGLYAIAICIRFFGIIGAPIGTVIAGVMVGVGQSWSLHYLLPVEPRRWLTYSTISVFLGVLPIGLLFLWILLVAVIGLNGVLVILGAIFGAILGGVQAFVLHPIIYEKVAWWVIANVFAAALCAPLSLTGTTFWLPVFCSLGPITFGLITAWALRYIINSSLDDDLIDYQSSSKKSSLKDDD